MFDLDTGGEAHGLWSRCGNRWKSEEKQKSEQLELKSHSNVTLNSFQVIVRGQGLKMFEVLKDCCSHSL